MDAPIGNLTQLIFFRAWDNQLKCLPASIGNLVNLQMLKLDENQLTKIPESIGNLIKLRSLDLARNQLTILPESIGKLINLTYLNIAHNQLRSLPKSITELINLQYLSLANNPLTDFDLSILKSLPALEEVNFLNVDLPRRYWTKLSEWKSEWLLDEDNAGIRRVVIRQIGYDRICQELDAMTIDSWREYTLLKIEKVEIEPMVLLKMICPSTAHIHILRVPPEMMSAEAAITWVNHGIHPDDIAVQT